MEEIEPPLRFPAIVIDDLPFPGYLALGDLKGAF